MKRNEIKINSKFNIIAAQKEISAVCNQIGFSKKEIEEILLVISELGDNLLHYKIINGRILYSIIQEKNKQAIEIISQDDGPGIANVQSVIEDGYSTSGSLGIGLGAVKRLMNEVKINSSSGNETSLYLQKKIGTTIITRKYLTLDTEEFDNKPNFSVYCRSKIGEIYNGDNYFIKHYENLSLISVIDGLGHGKEAHIVSQEAREYLGDNFRDPLQDLINQLHHKFKHTRGAAISIARINPSKNKLKYVGIGNVQTRLYRNRKSQTLLNYNGTIGRALRSFKILEYPWNKNNLLIMASDGISHNYNIEVNTDLFNQKPIIIAKYIFENFSKQHDDATILVGGT